MPYAGIYTKRTFHLTRTTAQLTLPSHSLHYNFYIFNNCRLYIQRFRIHLEFRSSLEKWRRIFFIDMNYILTYDVIFLYIQSGFLFVYAKTYRAVESFLRGSNNPLFSQDIHLYSSHELPPKIRPVRYCLVLA